ncbi:MAG TPA: c-type cytochrome biogenesis protein CcmI [Burkholderiales bacterium]|nr:c-type cytochrome biogenesis protein CcmI [Burkholderiales bacterium]
MTAFWVIAVLLAAGALAFVLPPLLRSQRPAPGAAVDATNVAVYRDQIRELEADLAAGTLAQEQYEEARRELEARLLADVQGGAAAPRTATTGRIAAIAAGIAIPVASILLYLAVGNPGALAPESESHGITRAQIESMVDRLAARMKENPEDATGWVMLGRSYAVLDRFPEAASAYANAVKRSPPDAQLLADYADALAMAQGRRLQGEPERLIAKALAIDPRNVKALALAGTAAFENKDFKGAIVQWRKILDIVPADSDMANSIRDSIADAQQLAGGPVAAPSAPAQPAAAAPATVSGTVRLDPALTKRVAPGDTVFIFARAVDGPRVPLAVTRREVRELPATFTLDDRMAMAPGMNLSAHARVVVGARVSKSGQPAPQPGDFEGLSSPVNVGASGVNVVIATEIR